MAAALQLVDETATGKVIHELVLELVSEKVTAREVIERRVHQEVAEFNREQEGKLFRGLVQPSNTEAELNGYRLKKPRRIDAGKQVEQALQAFEKNGFLMLSGDTQIETLDDEILVRA